MDGLPGEGEETGKLDRVLPVGTSDLLNAGYNKRTWLNNSGKSSTGSVVAYEGPSDWDNGTALFFEVADCHGKARLHKATNDSMRDFIRKLRTIAEEAESFARHLEAKSV